MKAIKLSSFPQTPAKLALGISQRIGRGKDSMGKLTEITDSTFNTKVPCPYKDDCTGCQYLDFSYAEQIQIKKDHLNKLFISKNLSPLEPIEFVSAGTAFLRDRLDFSLQDSRLGLYGKDRKNILDLEVCA
ncbi:MAG TPA: hypothetical protein VGE46_03540, partial [Bdellovibrio sp.]